MNLLKCILAVGAGGAFGCGVAFLMLNLGTLAAGVWIAIAAGLVLAVELCNAVRRSR
jgi:hypothetical protein